MQKALDGQVAWVTGAGSGIGQAAAVALAGAGARVALTSRRREGLEETAALIAAVGGASAILPADVADAARVDAVAAEILAGFGRCDILVNSAGMNIRQRAWDAVDADGFDTVIAANLNGCFYTSRAMLPAMRAQGGGLIIQVSSWGGRYVSPVTGPAYTAAKAGLNVLSESLNQAEAVNGIRSCCICPGEVATPILKNRPIPVSDEDQARMLQSEDLARTILFVAEMPASVCINEILISPTWNRSYIGMAKG
ncbi:MULTISPECIES: SDR family oxidoreductase [unclassified Phenylobacterium]|uniref:SDR family oxidoreductase n=1 Tax=unclassified Phenylobacterium TaxID=2640670 RepID=UPI00083A188D|nr:MULTISPECIES: SDR family NAD(P)-dependent oxidoreductase [unclassified Phenylobacterium]